MVHMLRVESERVIDAVIWSPGEMVIVCMVVARLGRSSYQAE